jgi:hypothetical protein
MLDPMTQQSNNPDGAKRSGRQRLVVHALGCSSLLCALAFWIAMVLHYTPGAPKLDLTALQFLSIAGVGIILAVATAALHSKLWRIALPFNLVMFFFVMYVMGT